MTWFRAHQLTRCGAEEVRLRSDGDYDIREIGVEAPYDVVAASFFRAEFCMKADCPDNVPVKWVPVDVPLEDGS